MAGNIFINYRRDESGHVAGRLHDSLASKFGRNKLFMDVDNIPVGRDFEDYLKSQVSACDAMLAIIGPNWLTAKDETGQRRLDNRDDFVAIEIGAALARDIPVVPVLVDGARMPKASELPDLLKPLARRHAVHVRHTNFNSDAETLVKRLREALGHDSPGQRRVVATRAVAAMAALLLAVAGGYVVHRYFAEQEMQRAALKWEEERSATMAEANRKVEATRVEQERQAKAAAETEEKRKAEQIEQQRLAAVKAQQERQARAAAEVEAKRKADEAERQRQAGAASNRGVCVNALNSEKSGWEQNPQYGPDVMEASRRGLTVDSCRQLVATFSSPSMNEEAAEARKAEQAERQRQAKNSLFTIRSGMAGFGWPADQVVLNHSIEECEQACTQRATCKVFTHTKDARGPRCYLYTRAELSPDWFSNSGVRN